MNEDNLKKPKLYGDYAQDEFLIYQNNLIENLDLYKEFTYIPSIRFVDSPIFSWDRLNRNMTLEDSWGDSGGFPIEVKFYNQAKDVEHTLYRSKNIENDYDKIDVKLIGNYAIIQNEWMGHYGHNIHDNLSRFEYIRQLFDSNIKFILTEYEDGTNEITKEQLLCIDESYYSNNLIYIPRNKIIEIDGSLIQLKKNYQWIHESKLFSKFLQKSLFMDVGSKKEKIIFCPRGDDAFHARRNTTQDVEIIKNLFKEIKKEFDGELSYEIFKCEDSNGNTMTIKEQQLFFQDATMIIGLHGTAMTNMIWSNRISNFNLPPLQIIEIVGSSSYFEKHTPNYQKFQKGNDNGYFAQFGGNRFNVSWRHLFYHALKNKSDYDYVTFSHKHLKKAILEGLREIKTHKEVQ